RVGRKRMLLIGSALMVFAGILFSVTRNFYLLLLAAIIGVISPSGNEVGPFLAIEQSALSEIVSGERRTQVFAWYQLAGSLATALGSLLGGGLAQKLQIGGATPLTSYRIMILAYAALGLALAGIFAILSSAIEPTLSEETKMQANVLGLGKSSKIVV